MKISLILGNKVKMNATTTDKSVVHSNNTQRSKVKLNSDILPAKSNWYLIKTKLNGLTINLKPPIKNKNFIKNSIILHKLSH